MIKKFHLIDNINNYKFKFNSTLLIQQFNYLAELKLLTN